MSTPYWLVMPAAGSGRRFGGPKQHAALSALTVLDVALRPFLADPQCRGGVLVLAAEDPRGAAWRQMLPAGWRCATGGAERVQSVRCGLAALADRAGEQDWVLVHDAARPGLSERDLASLTQALAIEETGALLAAPVVDTVKRAGPGEARIAETVARTGLWLAQTPQAARYGALCRAIDAALASARLPTDEAQALEWSGQRLRLVAAQDPNPKVTAAADLDLIGALLASRPSQETMMRVGSGFDVHAFGPGEAVVLGGIRVPYDRGVRAHSDGDVLLHALVDALLGAAGLGDIGQHFPDTDPRWRGADSAQFVRAACARLAEAGYRPVNADLTLLAEAPRVARWRDAIRANVAALLELPTGAVNLKATTTEQLGFIGRGEGLAAMATVLIAARG